MKNQTLPKLLWLLLIVAFASCGKNDDTQPPVTPPEPTPPVTVITDTLGAGWSKMNLPSSAILDLYFQNENTGYASGKYLSTTKDGGLNWDSCFNVRFSNITMSSDGVFYGVVYNYVYTSKDGKQFTSKSLGDLQLFDTYAVGKDTCYCIGSKGEFFGTYDAGKTWNKLANINFDYQGYTSLHFLNSKQGWAVRYTGVFATEDGGQSWKKGLYPDTEDTTINASIFASTSKTIYVGTSSGRILKSADGGETFTEIKKFNFLGLNYLDIHFVSESTGYCCYSNYIYKTIDAGSTWTKELVSASPLLEIHFTDANHGWACGIDGLILRYNQ